MNDQIIISGGGIAGLTLAICLGQENIPVSVIDPHPPQDLNDIKMNGHTTALMADSLKVLQKTGALDSIDHLCGEMNRLTILDRTRNKGAPKSQQIESIFDSLEIDQKNFGLNVPVPALRAALAREAQKYDCISLYFGTALYDVTDQADFIRVRLEDKTHLKGRLLIGADGRNSLTRHMAGITPHTHDYEQDALTFSISHCAGHKKTSLEIHRPGGPLTFVPLADAKQSAVVWVEGRSQAQKLMALKEGEFLQMLQNASGDVLGDIKLLTPPRSRELKMIVASKLTAPRIALMAEAAHVLHPMGAQGLNLSFRDVKALSRLILRFYKLGLDPGSHAFLKRYELQRKADIMGRVVSTHFLARSLHHNIAPLHILRRNALLTLSRTPPLKHILMKLGMTGQASKNG